MNEKCPNCGREVTQADATCPQCGRPLAWVENADGEPKTCAACGGKLEAGQKFCPGCGAPVGGRKEEEPPVQAAEKGSDAQNYDEAVRLGKEVDKLAGGAIDVARYLVLPLLLAGVFLGPELLFFVLAALIIGLASMCCRTVVKQRLEAHDVEGAKSALVPAKTCYWIAVAILGAGVVLLYFRGKAMLNE